MLTFALQPSLTFNPCQPLQKSRNWGYCNRSQAKRGKGINCVATSFDEALARNYVYDFGRVVQLNERGQSLPSNDLHIPNVYKSTLDVIKRKVLKSFKNPTVRCIFVRGSLVSNNFRRHGCDSDVDLIIFTDKELTNGQKKKLRLDIRNIVSSEIPASSVDVSFQNELSAGSRVSRSLASILRHYSVPLYGSLQDIQVPSGSLSPFMDLAKDIREQERRFKVQYARARETRDLKIQHLAVQWICKRCLRAVSDLCAEEERVHCRDLVPAFKIASKRYPQFSLVLLNTLQIACANDKNQFAGLGSQQALVNFAMSVIPDAVEIVEHLFLQTYFSDACVDIYSKQPMSVNTNSFGKRLSTFPKQLSVFISKIGYQLEIFDTKRRTFATHKLPDLAISPMEFGTQFGIIKSFQQGEARDSLDILRHSSRPTLIQNAAEVCDFDLGIGHSLLSDMIRRSDYVDCRVSPSNVVTFCRSEHPFLNDESFTAPSSLRSIYINQALDRMCTDCTLPPLVYNSQCLREHIYIQTNLPSTGVMPFFEQNNDDIKLDVAQPERLWVSTHGTVSSLHYDASHSALFQRAGKKRMILFPDQALQSLGVYPLGHPLHRRARVDISRESSFLFKEFWKTWARTAEIVTLNPGDLLIFPPFWAHYTESLVSKDFPLSISHTFRFW